MITGRATNWLASVLVSHTERPSTAGAAHFARHAVTIELASRSEWWKFLVAERNDSGSGICESMTANQEEPLPCVRLRA